MKYRSAIETSLAILTVLTENKDYAQYDLPGAIGKDYRTVLRHLRALETHHLIKLARHEPAGKRGKDKNIYALETNGLIAVLKIAFNTTKNVEDLEKDMDEIATIHKGLLPLLFGKWDFWAKHGVKRLILERFKIALAHTETPLLPLLLSDFAFKSKSGLKPQSNSSFPELDQLEKRGEAAFKRFKENVDNLVRNRFYKKVFMDYWFDAPAQFENFLLVLAKDADLRAFVDAYFAEEMKEVETVYTRMKGWLSFWQAQKNNSKGGGSSA